MFTDKKKINNIYELKQEFSILWKEISSFCEQCNYPDCLGYIWVLPEEEEELLDYGVETVQINGSDGPIFINSYQLDSNGCVNVFKAKPRCPHLCEDRKCSIHVARPLVCHMYPVGPDTNEEGKVVLGLHTECLYVENLKKNNTLDEKIKEIDCLIDKISTPFMKILMYYWRKIEYTYVRPDGLNSFIELRNRRLK